MMPDSAPVLESAKDKFFGSDNAARAGAARAT
jgi:hypothetical protein